jgi:hypothetical protein
MSFFHVESDAVLRNMSVGFSGLVVSKATEAAGDSTRALRRIASTV